MTIRVMLADDHRMVREALRLPLCAEPDIDVVAEANSGEETLAVLGRLCPDILVLDIGLPDINGIEVAKRALKRHPSLRIVALSGYADLRYIEEMLKAGAQGYVVKSAGADELIAAIRAVAGGRSFLSHEASQAMVRRIHHDDKGQSVSPPSVLGRRELQVLGLLAEGKRSAEIAASLGITVGTAEVHRRNIKQKLGLHTTAELTRYAIREGLIAS